MDLANAAKAALSSSAASEDGLQDSEIKMSTLQLTMAAPLSFNVAASEEDGTRGQQGSGSSSKEVAAAEGRPYNELLALLLLKWLPWTGLLSLIVVLLSCYLLSVNFSKNGNPCGRPLCDVSVYGAWPPNGPEFVVFRIGFVVIATQLVIVTVARLQVWKAPLRLKKTNAFLFGLSTISIVCMAFIPFFASPLHYVCAALTFCSLAIGQAVDALAGDVAFRRYRLVLLFSMVACFVIWFSDHPSPLVGATTLEYLAIFLVYGYFTTWSWEAACTSNAVKNGVAENHALSLEPCTSV